MRYPNTTLPVQFNLLPTTPLNDFLFKSPLLVTPNTTNNNPSKLTYNRVPLQISNSALTTNPTQIQYANQSQRAQ